MDFPQSFIGNDMYMDLPHYIEIHRCKGVMPNILSKLYMQKHPVRVNSERLVNKFKNIGIQNSKIY